jgi:hypothetical protein
MVWRSDVCWTEEVSRVPERLHARVASDWARGAGGPGEAQRAFDSAARDQARYADEAGPLFAMSGAVHAAGSSRGLLEATGGAVALCSLPQDRGSSRTGEVEMKSQTMKLVLVVIVMLLIGMPLASYANAVTPRS